MAVPIFQASFTYTTHNNNAGCSVVADAMVKLAEYCDSSLVVCEEEAILFAHLKIGLISGPLEMSERNHHLAELVVLALLCPDLLAVKNEDHWRSNHTSYNAD